MGPVLPRPFRTAQLRPEVGFAARLALVIAYLRHRQMRGHWFPKALCFWHLQFFLLLSWHSHISFTSIVIA
jgi:hypothetical protein